MQPEAILFIGIQAVGKTTFYQQHFATSHVHINLDTLKTRAREKALLASCIAEQKSFVVDNTNLSQESRARYINLAKSAGYRLIGYYFQSKAVDSIVRNRQRSAPQIVPDLAIWGAAKRLQLPKPSEGFDQLYYVVQIPPDGFEIEEWRDDL